MNAHSTTLPARSGKALILEMGGSLAIVNTLGAQVVDFRAFNAGDLGEFMSTPAPLNLFMNVPIGPTGRIEPTAPRGHPGDRVEFRAEMRCVVAHSACPHDIFPINGTDLTPRDVEYSVVSGAESDE